MGRGDLSDNEWAQWEPPSPRNGGRGGRWRCHRRVINGILFRQRTGLPWRDLPPRFGKWQTLYDRHRRWSADGTWEGILRAIQSNADGQIGWSMVSVDSSSCRTHRHSAGDQQPARGVGVEQACECVAVLEGGLGQRGEGEADRRTAEDLMPGRGDEHAGQPT